MDVDERSRKNEQIILRQLRSYKQCELAKKLEVSDSTVSRWKSKNETDRIEIIRFSKMLAHLGLKAVPVELKCYDPEAIDALYKLAQRYLGHLKGAEQLVFEDPE